MASILTAFEQEVTNICLTHGSAYGGVAEGRVDPAQREYRGKCFVGQRAAVAIHRPATGQSRTRCHVLPLLCVSRCDSTCV